MAFLTYTNGTMIWYSSAGIINFFDMFYTTTNKRDKTYSGYPLLTTTYFSKNQMNDIFIHFGIKKYLKKGAHAFIKHYSSKP